jgi:ABC-2 type transport system permease protein
VQVLVDGGDSNRATVARNAVQAYVALRSIALARERLASLAAAGGFSLPGTVRVEPRVLYNPCLDSRVFFVPGVGASLLLLVTMVVTAMGLAREKEAGTLEQVMVTPIGPGTFIMGKTIPYAMVGLVDLVLVVTAGAWIFGVPVRGSVPLLLAAGTLYLLTTLGLGLLIGTLARTQQQALFGAMFFLMPALLLSGFITPIDNMPEWLRPFTALNPVRHFVEVMRGVLLKDARSELLPQIVAMAGIGTCVFAVAVATLRRRM